jgi:hypothetical protein
MGGKQHGFLAQLPLPVLRSIARRLGVEAADDLDRDALVAALGNATLARAGLIGRTLRRFVRRFPTDLLTVPDLPPLPAEPAEGTATHEGELGYDTVSMADLLIRQGYLERARETLERIRGRNPAHPEVLRRLDEIRRLLPKRHAPGRPVPPPPGDRIAAEGRRAGRVEDPVFRPSVEPIEGAEPNGVEDPPAAYGRVYAGLMAVDARTLYAYWEATPEAVVSIRRKLGDPEARLALQLVGHYPGSPVGGERTEDAASGPIGERFFRDVRPGAHYRLAVGLSARGGVFEPICHTEPVLTPGVSSADEGDEVWMEVEPPAARAHAASEPVRIVNGKLPRPPEGDVPRRPLPPGELPIERLQARLHAELAAARLAPPPTSPANASRLSGGLARSG